ncbi:dynein axonemal light chain 4-like [Sycon ciliatum]|uniref:dynein axonemal light chain 4-like n=1 Tax=Sycon ciliatum TaxID=27933 RepID=UPI0020AC6A90|eukprot:scpid86225/ scgid28871/ Dynein light chain 4, axonemal &gt; Dynein light chain 4, axonemal &gt; Dynein light chain 4, axonemal
MADAEAPAGDAAAAGAEGGEAAAASQAKDTASDFRRAFNFPLLRHSDMNEEMRTEVMELCVTAAEKHAANMEYMARMIKETVDKKFGPAWHVVVGEGYSFEVTHEEKNILYMYFGGQVGMLVWKCS